MSEEIIKTEQVVNERVLPAVIINITKNEIDAFDCYVSKLFVVIDLLTLFFSTNNKTKAVRFCNEEIKKIKNMITSARDISLDTNISYYSFFTSLTTIKGNLVGLIDIQDPSAFTLENRLLKSTESVVDKYIEEIAKDIGIDFTKLKYEISINTIIIGNEN